MNNLDRLVLFFESLTQLEQLKPGIVPDELFVNVTNSIVAQMFPKQPQPIKEENE